MTLVEMLQLRADEIERKRAIDVGPSLAMLLRDAAAELLAYQRLTDAVGELHHQIMNLTAGSVPGSERFYPDDVENAYKLGLRDARHAAAELVVAALDNSTQSSPQAPTE